MPAGSIFKKVMATDFLPFLSLRGRVYVPGICAGLRPRNDAMLILWLGHKYPFSFHLDLFKYSLSDDLFWDPSSRTSPML